MADSSNNKVMAVLCYLWILWIVPLLTEHKNDPFVKFHINQGIILTIFSVIIGLIGYIPVIGGVISWIGGIALLILAIMGIINAVNMQEKPLPVIGTLFTVYK
ncbi:MAG: hypothetical protein R6W99_01875 [Clostridia bacterium]